MTGATRIDSDGGLLEGENLGAEVEVAIGEPRFGWDEIPLAYPMDTAALPMAWGTLEKPMAVNVGNPHLVFFVPDAREVPLDTLGPEIEHDHAFPERINVNVATCVDGRLKLRTFERGAGETLACGTGACASAVAAIVTKRAQSPVTVDMTGGSLTVSWAPGEPIRMRGAATHVFEGDSISRRCNERGDRQPRLPPQLCRERDDRAVRAGERGLGRRQQLRGD